MPTYYILQQITMKILGRKKEKDNTKRRLTPKKRAEKKRTP